MSIHRPLRRSRIFFLWYSSFIADVTVADDDGGVFMVTAVCGACILLLPLICLYTDLFSLVLLVYC